GAMSPGCWDTGWTGGHQDEPERNPTNGGAPPRARARHARATVEVAPPADDIWSAAHSRVAQLVEQPAVNRRVAGSSPASGVSRSNRIRLLRVCHRLDCARAVSYRLAVLRRAVTCPRRRCEQIRRLGCNRWRSRGRDRTPNLDGDSPKPSCLQECRKSAPQCRKNT